MKNYGDYFFDDFTDPVFSPCGKMVLVRRKKDKKIELFIIHVDSKSVEYIGTFEKFIDAVWSDDSKSIIIRIKKSFEDDDIHYEDDIPVWFDRIGFIDKSKEKIIIMDVNTHSIYAEFEKENVYNVKWYKGKLLITSFNRRNPYKEFTIYLKALDGEEVLFDKVSFYPVDVESENILLLGKDRKKYVHEHDYLYLFDGNKLFPLTEKYSLNNSPSVSFEVWHSSRMNVAKIRNDNVYFLTANAGKVLVEKMNIYDGKKETLFSDDMVVQSIDVSNDGEVFFTAVMNGKPLEIYTIKNEKIAQITSVNDEISNIYRFKKLNHFTYKSLGLEIDGWYLKPDKPHAPMIVFVHGGPKGSYGYVPYFLGQLLADEGFYILYTNPRGSNGYTEEFADVISKVGMEDFEDIMNGVKKLIEIEDVDEENIGITGISYGGFMTNVAVVKSNIFKAAVSENGISNWFTSYTFSDIGFWFDKELISGDPLEDKKYIELSPIYHAKNVETPILFIHSLEDYRCPLEQSLSFHTVLKDLNKESHIVIFKKGSHGHSVLEKPRHMLKRYKIIVEFFKSKLLTKGEFDLEKVIKG